MCWITKLAVFTVVAVVIYGGITEDCMNAICEAESGCEATNCTDDEGCGFYQITEPYYIDCGRPGDDLESCGFDRKCSEDCVKAYMSRYGTYCTRGRGPTCEDYARIHKGGPHGCRHEYTKDYWTIVKGVLDSSS